VLHCQFDMSEDIYGVVINIMHCSITFLISQEKWHMTVSNIVDFMTKKNISGEKTIAYQSLCYLTCII